jgi:hypothetical protein
MSRKLSSEKLRKAAVLDLAEADEYIAKANEALLNCTRAPEVAK